MTGAGCAVPPESGLQTDNKNAARVRKSQRTDHLLLVSKLEGRGSISEVQFLLFGVQRTGEDVGEAPGEQGGQDVRVGARL